MRTPSCAGLPVRIREPTLQSVCDNLKFDFFNPTKFTPVILRAFFVVAFSFTSGFARAYPYHLFFVLLSISSAAQEIKSAVVKPYNGRPTLFVNEQPQTPAFYALTHAYGGVGRGRKYPRAILTIFATLVSGFIKSIYISKTSGIKTAMH